MSDILEKIKEEYERVVIDVVTKTEEEKPEDKLIGLRMLEELNKSNSNKKEKTKSENNIIQQELIESNSTETYNSKSIQFDELSEQMSEERLKIIREKWSSYNKNNSPTIFSKFFFLYDHDDELLIKKLVNIIKMKREYNINDFLNFCESFMEFNREHNKILYKANYFNLLNSSIISFILKETSLQEKDSILSSFSKEANTLLKHRTNSSRIELEQYFKNSKRFEVLIKEFNEFVIKLTDSQISKTNYPDDMLKYRDENEFLLQVIFISELFDKDNILEKFSLDLLKKIRALTLQYNDLVKKLNIKKEKRKDEEDLVFSTRSRALDSLEVSTKKLYNSPLNDLLNKKFFLLEQELKNPKKDNEWLPKGLLKKTVTKTKQIKSEQKKLETQVVYKKDTLNKTPTQSVTCGEKYAELELTTTKKLNVLPKTITNAEPKITETFLLPKYNKKILKESEFGLLFDELTYIHNQLFEKWNDETSCNDLKCQANPHTKVACFHDFRKRLQHYYLTRLFFERLTKTLLSFGEQIHHRSHHVTSASNLSLTNLLPINEELHKTVEQIITTVLKSSSLIYYQYLKDLKNNEWRIQENNRISVDDLGITMKSLINTFNEYFKFLEKSGLAKKDDDKNYIILRPISEQYKKEVQGLVEITDTVDYFIHICQHVKDFPLKIVLKNPEEPVQPFNLFATRIKFGSNSKIPEIYTR